MNQGSASISTALDDRIRSDNRSVYAYIRSTGRINLLKELQTQSNFRSLSAIAGHWLAIAGCTLVSAKFSWWFMIPAVVVIGSRQRALSNLTHDAAHGNLFTSIKWNNVIGNLLTAFCMFDTVESYRRAHLLHHRHLGQNGDPDSISHFGYGYDDKNPPKGPAALTSLKIILSSRAWRDSLTGSLFSKPNRERSAILFWWLSVSVLLAATIGDGAFVFLGLWCISKATSFHVIRVFAEFLDHSGLQTGSIFSFTRNLPADSLFRHVTHPVCDTFHLTHHLLPKVPHYRLKEAHSILLGFARYKSAHHCDGYFLGKHSALQCWRARCQNGRAS